MTGTKASIAIVFSDEKHAATFRCNVTSRARFFKFWLRRIAPVTHVDQAINGGIAFVMAAFAAPEERWRCFAFNWLILDPWLPVLWRQSRADSVADDLPWADAILGQCIQN